MPCELLDELERGVARAPLLEFPDMRLRDANRICHLLQGLAALLAQAEQAFSNGHAALPFDVSNGTIHHSFTKGEAFDTSYGGGRSFDSAKEQCTTRSPTWPKQTWK